MKKLLIIILTISSFSNYAIEGVYEVIIRKQEEKQKSRWSLSDWLLTKQKIALMDQWLALHSSTTWFEFFLEGSGGELDFGNNSDQTFKANSERFQGGLYIKMLGLSGGVDHFSGSLKSSFYQGSLIVFGTSAQSTNFQLHYGKRNLKGQFGDFDHSFFGFSSTLYLLPFLGGIYEYRNYSDANSGDYRYEDGNRQEYGAFIDLWILRIRGTYFKERNLYSHPLTPKSETISGWWFGGQVFF